MFKRQAISTRASILQKAVYPGPSSYQPKYNREQALCVLNEVQNTFNTASLIVDKGWLANEKDESDLLNALGESVDKLKDLIQLIRTGDIKDTTFRTLGDIKNIEQLKQNSYEK